MDEATMDSAIESLQHRLSADYGPVSVRAGKGCILVNVGGRQAALDVRASIGSAYEGYPVVIQSGSAATATARRKGILTLYPAKPL